AQIYNFSSKTNIITDINRYSRYKKDASGNYLIKKIQYNKCKRLWQTSVITWQGKILPCCFDKSEDYIMGNINSESLQNIWLNKQYNSFRKQILKKRAKIDICNNCTE
ncbi:MAG: SPASM domain-containing protein, partial [Bacteroidales bacterium]|nr:SPASM domain-containing protein [Bacteroidales bacterium]